ncbi:predicted protein [Botrytis cinerea T4]|uniref:Uncharacterized protein n=1 Tax=Botryotinia fuckeliana (strain T4) TaxID=999810 RepID=G2Y829_BOTF4|nr:predicted protein [Botrytis cinerea T4]
MEAGSLLELCILNKVSSECAIASKSIDSQIPKYLSYETTCSMKRAYKQFVFV